MFKDKLKNLREREGLSQQELADKLFVSRSAVAKWENGNGIPSDVNIKAICKFFNVDKNSLILDKKDITYTIKQKFNYMRHLMYLIILDFTILVVAMVIIVGSYKEKKEWYNDLVFYENAVIIKKTKYFDINDENIKILKERFDYVNYEGNGEFDFSIRDVYERGQSHPISIQPMVSDFINTGVTAPDTLRLTGYVERGPQKLELLYGKIFNDESERYEIVIDLDTSVLCFGKENSVGEIVKTNHGEFKVIGVVSNTTDREYTKKINDYRGAEWHYNTYAYISYALARELVEEQDLNFNFEIQNIIVCDENKTANEIKHIIEILFNIPEKDTLTITTKDRRLKWYTFAIDQKTKTLYIISSVILLVGILGVLFIVKAYKEYKRINNVSLHG